MSCDAVPTAPSALPQFVPPADGMGHNICCQRQNHLRVVAVKMKPTAVTRCIIEIKGHEDIRVTLKTVTNTGCSGSKPVRWVDIKPSFMWLAFVLKGHVCLIFMRRGTDIHLLP